MPLVRLAARAFVRSWRWIPPTVTTLAALAVVYTTKSGLALPAYALTASLLVPITAWLTAAAGNVDDDAHQRLLVAASSRGLVHASRAVVGVGSGVALGAVSVAWPLVAGAVDRPTGVGGLARTVATGIGAHTVAALVGAAVGTFAHRPLVARSGGAVVVGVLGSLGAILAGIPFLRALGHDRAGVVAPALAVGLALAAAATFVAGRLADHAG